MSEATEVLDMLIAIREELEKLEQALDKS